MIAIKTNSHYVQWSLTTKQYCFESPIEWTELCLKLVCWQTVPHTRSGGRKAPVNNSVVCMQYNTCINRFVVYSRFDYCNYMYAVYYAVNRNYQIVKWRSKEDIEVHGDHHTAMGNYVLGLYGITLVHQQHVYQLCGGNVDELKNLLVVWYFMERFETKV